MDRGRASRTAACMQPAGLLRSWLAGWGGRCSQQANISADGCGHRAKQDDEVDALVDDRWVFCFNGSTARRRLSTSSALVCQRRRLFAFGMRAGGVIPSSWQPHAAHGVSCRWPQGMGDVVRRLERLSIGNKGGRQGECQRRLAARGEANRESHGSRGPRDGTDGFGARHACGLAHPRTEGSCVRQGPSDRHWPPTGWCHQRAQSSAQR